MKQLTKEELTQFVTDTMINVYKSNAQRLIEEIENINKNITNESEGVVKIFMTCMTELVRECGQVFVETLYHVLYEE